ncbi:MAG: hypothetical protein Sylvanvirus8_25 [Sylvanvirus sp.]|uniref:Uncharacterized protein n=1 Tax=Sylvanvirus sp. TaxID=2487774 RepID=A0A3G5ALC7_9VIRU|nr:MAG: hypothetical protein Sylvanvirus8_25 [Sylvanvirus sp.]
MNNQSNHPTMLKTDFFGMIDILDGDEKKTSLRISLHVPSESRAPEKWEAGWHFYPTLETPTIVLILIMNRIFYEYDLIQQTLTPVRRHRWWHQLVCCRPCYNNDPPKPYSIVDMSYMHGDPSSFYLNIQGVQYTLQPHPAKSCLSDGIKVKMSFQKQHN